MKAFKQINLKKEKQLVYSYAAVLSVLGCFIMLSPALAQDSDTSGIVPRVHIDVKKNFDQNGNLQEYDSTWSWSWSGNTGQIQIPDSSGLDTSLFNFFQFPDHWYNRDDSTLNAYFGLSPEFFDEFFNFPDLNLNLNDSALSALPETPHLYNNQQPGFGMMEQFRKEQQQMMKRMMELQAEHRKLLDKYFLNPGDKRDEKLKLQQNSHHQTQQSLKSPADSI